MGTFSVMSPEVLTAWILESYTDLEESAANGWPVSDPAAADTWSAGSCLLELFPETANAFDYGNAPETMMAQMDWVSIVLFVLLECMLLR